MTHRKMTFTKPSSQARIQRIVDLLSDGEARTTGDIAAATHSALTTAVQYVKKLRADKVIRISGFMDNKYPMYSLGSAPDAKRKPRQSNAQVCARYYRKKRQDPEFMLKACMRMRAYHTKPKANPFDCWIPRAA